MSILDDQAIQTLLAQSQDIPTQFHLQPANYFVVHTKEELGGVAKACLKNPKLASAEYLVVFTGDRRVAKHHLEPMLDQELESGNLTVVQAEALEQQVAMYFDTSPFFFGWFGKLVGAALMRLCTPMPQLACIHKREWLVKQVMRNASLFWVLAKERGFSADFIDTYDEWRVKLALGIPWYHVVVAIIAVGLQKEGAQLKTKIPLAEVLYWNK